MLDYNVKIGLVASRRMVDEGLLPYIRQVGLTGRTVSPEVYVALGISGAVHHIVGIRSSGTIIAINPDRQAPIFNYADYGIVAKAEDIYPLVGQSDRSKTERHT